MVRLGADSLAELAPAWDRAVDRTPGIDEFCASSLWSFAAAGSFRSAGEPVVVTDGVGFCGMRPTVTAEGVDVMVGLDPVWGFATPCVGPPAAAAAALDELLRGSELPIAVIGGQRTDNVLTAHVARRLERTHRLLRGPEEVRVRADLSAGPDAWLARRSSRFRQRLRRTEREAAARDVQVVDISADHPDAVIDRVLAIESRSWKGAAATGLASEDLAAFYRHVAWRLARVDALRALIAVADGGGQAVDIGFILGGVRGRTYRGLQLSYVAEWVDLGVGHLLQLHQIRAAAAEGVAVYDLGMDMEYKRRWADDDHATFSLLAIRDG